MSLNITMLQCIEYNSLKCLSQGLSHYSSRLEITSKTSFQYFRIEDDLSEEMQMLTAINLLYLAKFIFIFYPQSNDPIRVDRRENNGQNRDVEGVSPSQYCPCQLMAVWTGANELSSVVASVSILLSVVGKFPELKVRRPCRFQWETCSCCFAN